MRCASAPLLGLLVLLASGVAGPAFAAAGGPPGDAAAETRRAAAAELAALATRIEALKREVAAGRARPGQLEPLLTRAQELAALLDRRDGAGPPMPPPGPDAQELRERADALRDRADRLAAALAQLERRIGEARRRAALEDRLQALGGAGDLFAESSPRRVQGGARAGAATAPTGAPPPATSTDGAGTASSPSPGPATGPVLAPAAAPAAPPAAAPAAAAPVSDLAARAITSPPARDPEALLPGAGDSLAELQRKHARVEGELATLRAAADALEAEATAAEKMR